MQVLNCPLGCKNSLVMLVVLSILHIGFSFGEELESRVELSSSISRKPVNNSTDFNCRLPTPIDAGEFKSPVLGMEVESSRAIQVYFSALEIQPHLSSQLKYRLTSRTDSRFVSPVMPIKTGYDRQIVRFDGNNQPVAETRLHLLFSVSMKEGERYTLQSIDSESAAKSLITFSYKECRVTTSLQVSQAGYIPIAPKFAYAGNWLGSAGAMPIDNTVFSILDAGSGRVVSTGSMVLRSAADQWSGNDVYEARLPALHPGKYRMYVAGLGVSYVFSIDPDMAEKIYRKVARVLYHRRNSTPIIAPWAEPGFERPMGGVKKVYDGYLHPALSSPDYLFNQGEIAYRYRPVSKGWFDAGDYGQYVPNMAMVYWATSLALDLSPGGFADRELNIPESGNSIPDIIDELGWGIDWALSMQDADGGVYSRLASETWDETLPHLVGKKRLIYEKTTHATASFAAMAAIYARLIKPYDPVRATRAIAASEHAWLFLNTHEQWPAEGHKYKNPPGTHAGEYADASAADNLLWAAAELYRTTRNTRYMDYFQLKLSTVPVDPSNLPKFDRVEMAALWAIAMATPVSDQYGKRARKSLIEGASWRLKQSSLHPYRAPLHSFIGFAGWGAVGQSSRAVLPLLQGYALTKNPDYLQAAYASVYAQLGNNAQSLCYITGLGSHSPGDPLFKISQYDAEILPLPGLPINGPHFHLPGALLAHRQVNDAYFPPEQPALANDFANAYPVLRRYTDSHLLPPMSEPTVAEEAEVAMAFALISRAAQNLIQFY